MPEWTFGSIKMGLSSIFTTIVFLQLLNMTYALPCNYDLGVSDFPIECPKLSQDKDKRFCCVNNDTIPYCCDFGELMRTNTAARTSLIVMVTSILLLILICSCYCCGCYLLAKHEQQRGTVLYAPRL